MIYLPGDHSIHSCATGRCNSLTTNTKTTTAAACLCSHHPHPYNATTTDCSGPSQKLRVRNPLQPAQHCRAVEALLINCNSNPTEDQSGLSYQQIQMTPVASRKPQGPATLPSFTIDDAQQQQTVFVTFKPLVPCVSGSAAAADGGSQSGARTDLDLVRDSLSKDQLSLSSSHDSALNDKQIVTS